MVLKVSSHDCSCKCIVVYLPMVLWFLSWHYIMCIFCGGGEFLDIPVLSSPASLPPFVVGKVGARKLLRQKRDVTCEGKVLFCGVRASDSLLTRERKEPRQSGFYFPASHCWLCTVMCQQYYGEARKVNKITRVRRYKWFGRHDI